MHKRYEEDQDSAAERAFLADRLPDKDKRAPDVTTGEPAITEVVEPLDRSPLEHDAVPASATSRPTAESTGTADYPADYRTPRTSRTHPQVADAGARIAHDNVSHR